MSSAPVIIEAAINGATSRERNPNVPREPEEITNDILASIGAGAAIIHNHIDRYGTSGDEAAERYLEAWRPVLDERPDALIYPTVNFGPDGHNYDHIAPLAKSGMLRVGLCDPGSVNLGQRGGDVPSGGMVYGNSFDDITYQLELMSEYSLGVSLAIYEPGFLRCALAWQRAGQLPARLDGEAVLLYRAGVVGHSVRSPSHREGTRRVPRAARRQWARVGGVGVGWRRRRIRDGRPRARGGGHLHLGLEFYGGDRTPTNVELITEAVARCEAHGRPVATPDEAAAILGIPARA